MSQSYYNMSIFTTITLCICVNTKITISVFNTMTYQCWQPTNVYQVRLRSCIIWWCFILHYLRSLPYVETQCLHVWYIKIVRCKFVDVWYNIICCLSRYWNTEKSPYKVLLLELCALRPLEEMTSLSLYNVKYVKLACDETHISTIMPLCWYWCVNMDCYS